MFNGSADDVRDGFIHFSTAAQVAETAPKAFCRPDWPAAGRGRRRGARGGAAMGALARRRTVPASLWRAARLARCVERCADAVRVRMGRTYSRSLRRDRPVRSPCASAAARVRSGGRPSAGASWPEIASCRRRGRTTIRGWRCGLFGLNFPNPVGMAAGFDKNAEVPDALAAARLRLRRGRHRDAAAAARQSAAAAVPAASRRGASSTGSASTARARTRCCGGWRRAPTPAASSASMSAPTRIRPTASPTTCSLIETFAPVASYVTVNISSPNTPGPARPAAGPGARRSARPRGRCARARASQRRRRRRCCSRSRRICRLASSTTSSASRARAASTA